MWSLETSHNSPTRRWWDLNLGSLTVALNYILPPLTQVLTVRREPKPQCETGTPENSNWHQPIGAPLGVWWLRLCLAMQGTWVQTLVGDLRSHTLGVNSWAEHQGEGRLAAMRDPAWCTQGAKQPEIFTRQIKKKIYLLWLLKENTRAFTETTRDAKLKAPLHGAHEGTGDGVRHSTQLYFQRQGTQLPDSSCTDSQFLGRLIRSPGYPGRKKGSGILKEEERINTFSFFLYIP